MARTITSQEQHFPTTLEQLGRGNIMAISGGRIQAEGNTLVLPVRYGYSVEVDLAWNDTYTVRRVFTRSGARTVKGEVANVYCDMLGDTAYRASCFRDTFA